jgi:predicted peptidase
MSPFLVAFGLTLAVSSFAGEKEFAEHVYTDRDGTTMPYRLLVPEDYDKGKKYPLVFILHGWGERGTDNQAPVKAFGAAFLKAETRKKFACFVLLPQAKGSWIAHPKFEKPIPLEPTATASLQLAIKILDQVQKTERVDRDRIYLMGYSNGACGVWELLERTPRRWAAAAPMAGAGDPKHVAGAKGVPIWAFHGADDATIPLERMKELMSALQSAHGSAMYTIVPKGQHYDARVKGLAEPNLFPWMFAQQRGKAMVPFDDIAGPSAKRPTILEKPSQTAGKPEDKVARSNAATKSKKKSSSAKP